MTYSVLVMERIADICERQNLKPNIQGGAKELAVEAIKYSEIRKAKPSSIAAACVAISAVKNKTLISHGNIIDSLQPTRKMTIHSLKYWSDKVIKIITGKDPETEAIEL